MKAPKNIWTLLPSHYWTGIMVAVINVVWVGIDAYLKEPFPYNGRDLLVSTILTIANWPTDLHYQVFDTLTYRAQHTGDWGPIGYTGYHYIGFVVHGIFFALIGMFV